MSTFKNPVGPQPAKVYWRRRLLVGLGLLAVIVIIILIVVRPGSGAPAPDPSGSSDPGSSATDEPTDDASGDAGELECDPAKVTLEPVTDASSYEAGINPLLSFTLKSTMTEPCLIEAGSDIQEFRITSGEELIWSSKDCQTDAVAATTTLQPGVPKQSTPIPWDRTRSSPDTCDVPGDQVTAGGASYHLEVIIGEFETETTKQFLLY